MNVVIVKTATNEYPVIVGENILSDLGCHIAKKHTSGKAAIISDSNVWPVYGKVAEESLHKAGFETVHHCFPAGENSKNAETYLSILNFLAKNQITRSDILVALGGGVVGDITGFAAATYLRGIPYIQVPTTLLAMVDSSVGGKTAIDLPAGKNLVGAFYQPSLVVCDTSVLNSLPVETFRDGCAEVIKYAILYDKDLFNQLMDEGPNFKRIGVISSCISLKAAVVSEDEFDTGNRQKLNLGHTFGHAIEKLSNFSITHGQAVAIGMKMAAKTAWKHKICSEDTLKQIQAILDRFALPNTTDFNAFQLASAALSDKKRTGAKINLILPREIGSCTIYPADVSELQFIIEEGL